jgi:hypothetical protein
MERNPPYLNHARYENHTLTSSSGWSATLWNMFNRVVTNQNVVIWVYCININLLMHHPVFPELSTHTLAPAQSAGYRGTLK